MEGKSCRFQIQWPTNIFFLLSFLGYLIGIPAANAAAVRQYQFDVRKKKDYFCISYQDQEIINNVLSFGCVKFQIQVKNVSRLCHAKPIVTVNGMFPGPTVYVREGDQVLINVTNHAKYNMSIHW